MDLEYTIDKVMKTHKRKVSQFDSLKQELGLIFDEEKAIQIAKETMKQRNANNIVTQQISVEHIVNKARKEHKRKVSQFQAIKYDINQYIQNEEESTKLAAEVMKEYNPNHRSGKGKEILINDIVEKAMNNHRRKVSQFRSVQKDLDSLFNEQDVNAIAKDAMKQIFAQKQTQKHLDNTDQEQIEYGDKRRGSEVYLDEEAMRKRQERSNYVRKESVATPDIFGDGYDPQQKVHIEKMQQQIDDLMDLLEEKNKEIDKLKQMKAEIIESKVNLAKNSNHCLNEMREYLIKYQQSIFRG